MKKDICILLVEDDDNLSFVVKDFLEMNGYTVDIAEDGKEGLSMFENKAYDLFVLDVMLPKMDGFKLAERIRKKDERTPIIFLTAKSMQEDKNRGLQSGADDYITKPFDTQELILRIRAILKRSLREAGDPLQQKIAKTVEMGKYTYNTSEMVLSFEGEDIKLTPKEGKLLTLLYQHKNDILSRNEALKSIWGESTKTNGRSMDVYITRLRKYIAKDDSVKIENLHGKGFKLEF
jgi:DNA-binding response OmpR family regulator